VDPRSATGIVDPAGALQELPGAVENLAALLAARSRTQERLTELRTRVDEAAIPPRASLVLFGSWGRHELTDESDYDWGLLIDDPDLDLGTPTVTAAVEHVREVFDDGPPPGQQQYFGCAFHSEPLCERIGLDEDDTRNLTRRMLLLLESVAVVGEEVQREAQDRILERYLERHRRDYRPPRFLLNDVIRYWRTICVDFEGKVAQDAALKITSDKYVMRNAKLRTSRKMLYASGLLPVLLCHHLRADDIAPYLQTQIRALATDRVARAFLHLGQADAGLRTLAAYSDWIDLMSDTANRDVLASLDEHSRFENPVFRRARQLGKTIDNGLTGVLFETSLGYVARKHVAI